MSWDVLNSESAGFQVTGTAKQHVADDYNMRIAAGREEADAVARRGLEALLLRRRESGYANCQGRTVQPQMWLNPELQRCSLTAALATRHRRGLRCQ